MAVSSRGVEVVVRDRCFSWISTLFVVIRGVESACFPILTVQIDLSVFATITSTVFRIRS